MKALILSCNTGAGHNACAGAVQEALMRRGIPCDIRDGLSFLSKEASRFISQWFVRLYRNMPRLFDEGYSYAERHAQTMDEDSMIYRFLGLGSKSLRACIASQGYTEVICTHLFPAMMLTQIQHQDPLPVTTAFIPTDFTVYPGYEVIHMDWCFIPTPDLTADYIKADMPAERIVGCGIPVSRAFQTVGDRASAKRTLGIDEDHRHLLVMSGSMGCGPLKRILRHAVQEMDDGVEISVICGSNRKLSRQLSHQYGEYQNVHIHDFVDYVSLFMDSADLFMTKPGGLSVSEALCKRMPMALIHAVEGCETYNLRYCLEKGAAVTADSPSELAHLCARLIHDDDALQRMRDAMPRLSERSAADTICDCLYGNAI